MTLGLCWGSCSQAPGTGGSNTGNEELQLGIDVHCFCSRARAGHRASADGQSSSDWLCSAAGASAMTLTPGGFEEKRCRVGLGIFLSSLLQGSRSSRMHKSREAV